MNAIAPALLVMHLWGSKPPLWAREWGHFAAMMARNCQRREMLHNDPFGRTVHVAGCGEFAAGDSALIVATLDTLSHASIPITYGRSEP